MSKFNNDREYLIENLFEIGSIKFGEYTLKSGLKSPIYFDMRLLVSHPKLLKLTSDLMREVIENLEFDILCGVPYGAIPLATALSISTDKPMILKRKDGKEYGTKKLLEGIYKKDDRCLIVEDVVTYGDSILETVESLNEQGVRVSDAIVILDRCQGARNNIEDHQIHFHSLITAHDVLDLLLNKNKITQKIHDDTMVFLSTNSCAKDPSLKIYQNGFTKKAEQKELDFVERAKLAKNLLTKQLFEIMSTKRTNLCVAVDIEDLNEIIDIADKLGPHICVLKTHVDIIRNFDIDKMKQLYGLSMKHNFLVFEDRKFADIGNTVKLQYTSGIYRISEWSHIINAHPIPGPGIIQGLKEGNVPNGHHRGCLLIAQMSSKGCLINQDYVKETVSMAEKHSDFVIGFICQSKVSNDPAMLHMTPGVQLQSAGDSLGQQYSTPENAIIDKKCDIIIVGRGITSAPDPVKAAINYKTIAFDAYLKRINSTH